MARFTPIKITRVGGSLFIRLPLEFVRANNLKAGDMLMPDLDTFKVVTPEEIAEAEAAVYEGLVPAE